MATEHSEELTSSEKPTSSTTSLGSSHHTTTAASCSPLLDKVDQLPRNTSHSNCSFKVTSLPKTSNQSKYNKKQFCLYCKKAVSKLARHLESAHNDQPDVARAFSFNKRSRERRDLLCFLEKRGNFDHNAIVVNTGSGEMVACRRATTAKQSVDYRHCKFCQGLYARKSLWRHVKKCPQKFLEDEAPIGRKWMHLELPKPDQVHEAVWKIASDMNQDDIGSKAVRAVAGYEFESNSYKTPSLALKLGHSLAKVAGIVQCNAIIANRQAVAESAKQFATLHEKKWTESISSAALATLQQAKWNKPQVLPFTYDVSLLHKFLAAESAKSLKNLEEKPNSTTFGKLAQMTRVVLFNKKRRGSFKNGTPGFYIPESHRVKS